MDTVFSFFLKAKSHEGDGGRRDLPICLFTLLAPSRVFSLPRLALKGFNSPLSPLSYWNNEAFVLFRVNVLLVNSTNGDD